MIKGVPVERTGQIDLGGHGGQPYQVNPVTAEEIANFNLDMDFICQGRPTDFRDRIEEDLFKLVRAQLFKSGGCYDGCLTTGHGYTMASMEMFFDQIHSTDDPRWLVSRPQRHVGMLIVGEVVPQWPVKRKMAHSQVSIVHNGRMTVKWFRPLLAPGDIFYYPRPIFVLGEDQIEIHHVYPNIGLRWDYSIPVGIIILAAEHLWRNKSIEDSRQGKPNEPRLPRALRGKTVKPTIVNNYNTEIKDSIVQRSNIGSSEVKR